MQTVIIVVHLMLVLALIATRFEEALVQERPAGDFDPRALASIYVASLRGFTLQWAGEPDLKVMERDVKCLKAMLKALCVLYTSGALAR